MRNGFTMINKTTLKITIFFACTAAIVYAYIPTYFLTGEGIEVKQIQKKSVRSDEEITTAIMNYPIPNMIARCKKDFKYTDEDMVILERELKRYFVLCALKNNKDRAMGMYSSDVDNLWHSFILFTKEYARFGREAVGYFLHHVPKIEGEPQPSREKKREELRYFIEQYEKTFGEPPHGIWFLDACERQNNDE